MGDANRSNTVYNLESSTYLTFHTVILYQHERALPGYFNRYLSRDWYRLAHWVCRRSWSHKVFTIRMIGSLSLFVQHSAWVKWTNTIMHYQNMNENLRNLNCNHKDIQLKQRMPSFRRVKGILIIETVKLQGVGKESIIPDLQISEMAEMTLLSLSVVPTMVFCWVYIPVVGHSIIYWFYIVHTALLNFPSHSKKHSCLATVRCTLPWLCTH